MSLIIIYDDDMYNFIFNLVKYDYNYVLGSK